MDRETTLFRDLLKRQAYFATKPRLRLFKTLQKGSSTVKELVARLPKDDQATVYRNLKLFEQLGVIHKLHMGWNSRYELSDIFQHHHHHLTCSKCGRVIILRADPMLEEIISRLSVKNGFQPMDHQLEIRGLCRTCQTIDNGITYVIVS